MNSQKTKLLIIFIASIVILGILLTIWILSQQPNKIPVTVKAPEKVIDVDAKDIHWLNNNELAFTYFNQAINQRSLAKTSPSQPTILLGNPAIKMSEVFWSKQSNLLIFDYGATYRSYIFNSIEGLRELGINGYAYSWSPNGAEIFLLVKDEKSPKFYEIATRSFRDSGISFDKFNSSLWSPNNRQILLYNFSIETEMGQLYLFDINSHAVSTVSESSSIIYPSWSPKGDMIAYVKTNGLYIQTIGQPEKLIYQSLEPTSLSYYWLNNDKIIVFNGQTSPGSFWEISTANSQKNKKVLQNLDILPNQQVSFSLSPDGKNLAIATTHNGLWVVKDFNK